MIRGLESFSGDYLDDIAIFRDTWKEHLRHIRKVLLCLRESNLTAKPVNLGCKNAFTWDLW